MDPWWALVIIAFGSAIGGLVLQAVGGASTSHEHPFVKALGYALIGLGIVLGVFATLAVGTGADNPEWFM